MFESHCNKDGASASPAAEATDITVYKANWDRNAWDLVKEHRALRLHVFGPDSLVFRESFQAEARSRIPWTGITEIDRAMADAGRRGKRSSDAQQKTMVSEDMLIAAIVAARLAGVPALLALLALCLHAIDLGYRVEIELGNTGPMPWQQELTVSLTP